jgi:hypothetical protein
MGISNLLILGLLRLLNAQLSVNSSKNKSENLREILGTCNQRSMIRETLSPKENIDHLL